MSTGNEVATRVRERRRLRALAKLGAALLVPLLVFAGLDVWYNRQVDIAAADGAKVDVIVRTGWDASDIADALERAKVIDAAWVFKVYSRLHHVTEFEAGEYQLRTKMGVKAALGVLASGPKTAHLTLKILPGLWLPEVADQVALQLGLDATKFIDLVRTGAVRSKYQPASIESTEGLLYPDTYFFAKNVTERDVVQAMVRRFDAIADSIDLTAVATSSGRSAYDVIIVGSIVQLEVRLNNERPLVASVIYNRLRGNMKLQIDATVLYSIGERKRSTTEADRQTDSPYNTYRNQGLPPTPIATMGKGSLSAALHPSATDFLYYVLIAKNGRQAFSATYDEFLANKKEAQRLGLLG